MPSLWSSYWKILKLNPEPFESVKQEKDGLWFALKLFIVVALIAGLGKLAGIGTIIEQPLLTERVLQLADGIEEFGANTLPILLAEPAQTVADVVREIETLISGLQPPIGTRSARIIRLVGEWLSTPFDMFTGWLGFMLVIWIFARFIGGQGTIRQHISLLTLAAAPQVLTLVNNLPTEFGLLGASTGISGRILSIIALVWSLAIVVQGMAIAHNIEHKQAFKILVTFVAVIFIFIPILAVITGVYILDGAR